MKPVKLIIEGINSFIERQELDFEAVGKSNLFCICGKTGAGKTTIFDSLMLALYGKSGKGNLADTVNLSLMSAFVSLEFTQGDERYVVERTIKCRYEKDSKGNPTDRRIAMTECMLYKNGEPFAKGSDEANAKISEIIGLDISEFKNVYLLEQGEYAEFLKKQPAKQTEAVGKIFSLMRFGEVYKRAVERKKEEDLAVLSADERIRDLGDASAESVRAVKAELSAMRAKNTALLKDIEKAEAEADALEKARVEYAAAAEKQKAVKAHAQKLDEQTQKRESAEIKLKEFDEQNTEDFKPEIERLRAEQNRLKELNALDKQYEAAEKEQVEKAENLASKRENYEKTIEIAQKAAERTENEYALISAAIDEFTASAAKIKKPSAALESALMNFAEKEPNTIPSLVKDAIFSLREDKTAYDGLCREKEKAENRVKDLDEKAKGFLNKTVIYAEELKRLKEQAESAQNERDKAAEELEKAMSMAHVSSIRETLKAGDICPVCGGTYNGEKCENVDISAHREILEKAEKALKEANEAVIRVERNNDVAKNDYVRTDGELKAAIQESAEINKKIENTCVDAEVYGELSKALGKADKLCKSYVEAAAERAKAEPELSAGKAACEAAETALLEAEKRAAELKDRLNGDCGKTGVALEKITAELEDLERRAEQKDKARAALLSEAEAAKAAETAVKAMLDEAIKDCPVDIPEFDEQAYSEKRAICDELKKRYAERDRDIAVKNSELNALTEKAEKLKNISAERAAHARKADNYGKIAELTKGKSMLNYVAAEYIEQFTLVASDILGELSGGKYAMNYDTESGFTVSDFLNDGKARKTDTLSGGELFLASLSVAIAIARAVGNGNNAFFFLDEGFGTLDEELIDTVYAALESLSRDCLVGVISHAGALIERMPSCVEVMEATDVAGSRIVY